MYKVIKLFHDLQDKNHEYREGDTYPRAGLKPSKKRIEELAGTENKRGCALIELVEDENETGEENAAKEADEAPTK